MDADVLSVRAVKTGDDFCLTFVLEQEGGTVQRVAVSASTVGHHPYLSVPLVWSVSAKPTDRDWSRRTFTTSIGLLVAEQQRPANPLAARCVGRPSENVPG